MGEDPEAQQDFADPHREGRDLRQILAEDTGDDHAVPRDAIEQLAVEPVENPYGSDQDPEEEMETLARSDGGE